MAFGKTDPGDESTWEQKPPSKTESQIPEPPEHEPPPPTDSGSPAPPATKVDVSFVANLGRESLPKDADFQDFVSWSHEQLPQLVQTVVSTSGGATECDGDKAHLLTSGALVPRPQLLE